MPVRSLAVLLALAASSKLSTQALSTSGLPLKIDVPDCAQVSRPLVKVADNQHDVILSCDSDGLAPAFAIQLGPAVGKVSAKQIAADADFKGWTKKDPALLRWKSEAFSQPAENFMARVKLGGVEYVCFNQFPGTDAKVLAAELLACRSLRAT